MVVPLGTSTQWSPEQILEYTEQELELLLDQMGIIRWGITAGAHDASLTVFDDYDIKFAAHAERSSGVKFDKNQIIHL